MNLSKGAADTKPPFLTSVSTIRRETFKQGKMAPTVPESVLKKRKRNEEWASKKAADVTAAKAAAKTKRQDIFKRAEQYVAEYRSQVKKYKLV